MPTLGNPMVTVRWAWKATRDAKVSVQAGRDIHRQDGDSKGLRTLDQTGEEGGECSRQAGAEERVDEQVRAFHCCQGFTQSILFDMTEFHRECLKGAIVNQCVALQLFFLPSHEHDHLAAAGEMAGGYKAISAVVTDASQDSDRAGPGKTATSGFSHSSAGILHQDQAGYAVALASGTFDGLHLAGSHQLHRGSNLKMTAIAVSWVWLRETRHPAASSPRSQR
jgi:hypothetical protein